MCANTGIHDACIRATTTRTYVSKWDCSCGEWCEYRNTVGCCTYTVQLLSEKGNGVLSAKSTEWENRPWWIFDCAHDFVVCFNLNALQGERQSRRREDGMSKVKEDIGILANVIFNCEARWFLDYCLSLVNNTNIEIINGCWEIIGSCDERCVWTNEMILLNYNYCLCVLKRSAFPRMRFQNNSKNLNYTFPAKKNCSKKSPANYHHLSLFDRTVRWDKIRGVKLVEHFLKLRFGHDFKNSRLLHLRKSFTLPRELSTDRFCSFLASLVFDQMHRHTSHCVAFTHQLFPPHPHRTSIQ